MKKKSTQLLSPRRWQVAGFGKVKIVSGGHSPPPNAKVALESSSFSSHRGQAFGGEGPAADAKAQTHSDWRRFISSAG